MSRLDIPGYTLGRRLGGGPTCDVFLAADSHGRTVALKVLKAASERDPLAVLLIRREARAASLGPHSQVVSIRESHVARSPYWLCLDYISGPSLKQRLLDGERMSVSMSLAMVRQIAEGLTALHKVDLIHGDVKTANVLLPSPGKAILIDLGFAHKSGELSPWIENGHVIGTANYLAPEMASLPPHDSTASDLFSLGVILYELLTGQLPYPGRSTKEVVKHRRKCQPAQLPWGQWPNGLSELVAVLTDPDPAKRPIARQLVTRLAALQIASLAKKAG